MSLDSAFYSFNSGHPFPSTDCFWFQAPSTAFLTSLYLSPMPAFMYNSFQLCPICTFLPPPLLPQWFLSLTLFCISDYPLLHSLLAPHHHVIRSVCRYNKYKVRTKNSNQKLLKQQTKEKNPGTSIASAKHHPRHSAFMQCSSSSHVWLVYVCKVLKQHKASRKSRPFKWHTLWRMNCFLLYNPYPISRVILCAEV